MTGLSDVRISIEEGQGESRMATRFIAWVTKQMVVPSPETENSERRQFRRGIGSILDVELEEPGGTSGRDDPQAGGYLSVSPRREDLPGDKDLRAISIKTVEGDGIPPVFITML